MIWLPPVVSSAGVQVHALAIPPDDQSVTVMLDLAPPIGPRGWLGGQGWDARVHEAGGKGTTFEHATTLGGLTDPVQADQGDVGVNLSCPTIAASVARPSFVRRRAPIGSR
jgi:hypothetical protein